MILSSGKNLYDYADYRELLRDFCLAKKAQDKRFSLGWFGQKTGMTKVAVKYVIDGQRHLAEDKLEPWAACLGLKGEAQAFFKYLVLFNKSRSHSDRTKYFNKLLNIKGSTLKSRFIDSSDIGCFQAWYYPAIAEMSYLPEFQPDEAWIQRRLRFPVALSQIKKALQFLTKQGLLKGSAQPPTKIKTPDAFSSHVYKSYVLEQLTVAAQAVEKQTQAERETFTLTVSVDKDKFAVVKQRLAAIRHELHDLLGSEAPADRVIQINLNMFTLATGQENA